MAATTNKQPNEHQQHKSGTHEAEQMLHKRPKTSREKKKRKVTRLLGVSSIQVVVSLSCSPGGDRKLSYYTK